MQSDESLYYIVVSKQKRMYNHFVMWMMTSKWPIYIAVKYKQSTWTLLKETKIDQLCVWGKKIKLINGLSMTMLLTINLYAKLQNSSPTELAKLIFFHH